MQIHRHDLPHTLADYPLAIELPVQWGHLDAFGHVNNVHYFRWFESARIAYLNESGLTAALDQEGLGPILASIRCDYRRQLNFPDSILVAARVERIGRTSLGMSHRLYSLQQQALIAEGDSVVVLFDYQQQRSRPISDPVRQQIADFEHRELP